MRTPRLGELPREVRTTLRRLRAARARLNQAFQVYDRAERHGGGEPSRAVARAVEHGQRVCDRLYEDLNRQRNQGRHALTDAEVSALTRPWAGWVVTAVREAARRPEVHEHARGMPVIGPTVIDNMEEIEMSKRNNVGRDIGSDPQTKRGGGRWLVALLAVGIGGYFAVQALTGYLVKFAPNPAASGDLSVGTWAVAIVVGLFLLWCFTGSNGGRR